MPVITPATAREFAAKAVAARRLLAAKRLEAPPPPEPDPVQADYVADQLARTRKQIDLCNDLLEDPKQDWKARKAIADAKARLYEIEAALANRPKPGQLRPAMQRPARTGGGPIAAEPE